MKNGLMTKSLIFGIVVIFIGASAVSAIDNEWSLSPQSMNRGWLYVGGGLGNYTTIQDAINNATNGDTIFVYNGTYNENVDTKQKKIILIGEDRDTTFIHGQTTDPVVRIGTSDTSVSGFTMNGSSTEIILQVASLGENIYITNNLMQGGGYGIVLGLTSNKVTITNNTITSNMYIGIQLQTSTYNLIKENRIENNGAQGIEISQISHHNSILNNTIINNGKEGILVNGLTSTENTIEGNNISNNQIGIRFSGGTSANKIIGNNIEESIMEGVLFQSSSENTIEMNNFIDNKRQATFKLSSRNTWDANYWSNWIGFKLSAPIFQKFPKAIIGGLRINFDTHPAKQPYNISITV